MAETMIKAKYFYCPPKSIANDDLSGGCLQIIACEVFSCSFVGICFKLRTNQLGFPEVLEIACDLSGAEFHPLLFSTILWRTNGLPPDFAIIFEGYGY